MISLKQQLPCSDYPGGTAWPETKKVHQPTYECTYVTARAKLGDGHFSVVKECMNTLTKERYAMKLVHKALVMDKLQLIQREVSVLKKVSSLIKELEERQKEGITVYFEGHHHVLQLFDYFETSANIVLITQLCEPEDLYDRILSAGHLDIDSQVKPFTACLVSALEFLHENGIIHRDIKAENILFRLKTKGKEQEVGKAKAEYDTTAHDIILGDFGLALDSSVGSKEFVGTVSYLAPEIVACRSSARMSSLQYSRLKPYGKAVDIWALGVLCYFMAFGYMPFDCDTEDETMECISKSDYYVDDNFARDLGYEQLWSFVTACFTKDADKRPSAHYLKSHRFISPEYFPLQNFKTPTQPPFSSPSLRSSKSSTSLHNLNPPTRNNTSISFGLPEIMAKSDSRDANLNKIRETLRKTLSMTSIKRQGESQYAQNGNDNNDISNNQNSSNSKRKNSTFILEPEPPVSALMNGCLCATPESRSNFTTSPAISRNQSRSNIQTAISSWNENSVSGLNSGATLASSNFSGLNLSKLADIGSEIPKSVNSKERKPIIFQLGDENENNLTL